MASDEFLNEFQRVVASEAHANALIVRTLLACLFAERTEAEIELIAELIPAVARDAQLVPRSNESGAEFIADVMVRAQTRLEAEIAQARAWSSRIREALRQARKESGQAHE